MNTSLEGKEFKTSEYAVMISDDRDHVRYTCEGLFAGVLFEESLEKWSYYKVFDLEFPSDEELSHMKGIIFPGSKYSVYDTTVPWIEPYKQFIRKVYDKYPSIKLVGICFGH